MSRERPTEPNLWLCAQPDDYVAAARAWSPGGGLPILGEGEGAGAGHGRELVVAPLGERPASADATAPDAGDPRRLVVSFAHPVVEAGAGLLARAGGRRLVVLEPGREPQALAEIFAGAEALTSLAVVAPAWDEHERPDPSRLFALLRRAREHHAALRRCAWGMVTGADLSSFTRVIAKSILGPEIAAAHASAQSLVFTTGSAAGNWISLPRFDPQAEDTRAPLLVVDDADVVSKRALEVVDRRWSLLFFKGHGRPYCACQGYLCGARSLLRSASEPSEGCVMGMDCASPRDDSYRPGFPAFPRIDPRRYHAPVVVMDCCGTGNLSSPVWATGIPAVSFHVLAGSASAVITGDQVTMTRSGSYVDVLWALRSSATLGEAVARLNEVRPEANAALPYFLLGDPELVAGAARWPGWIAEAEPLDLRPGLGRFHIPADGAAPFVRAALSDVEAPRTAWTWHASVERDTGVELGKPRGFRSWAGDELWLDLARTRPEGVVELRVEQRASLALDPELREAALTLDRRMRAWTPAVREWAGPLREAGERILRLGARLAELERRAVVGEAADFEAALALTQRGWIDAHARVVDRAVEGLVAGGLWPFRLWAFSDFAGETWDQPCPYCGIQPTLLRSYQSWPAGVRQQWECIDCALIHDRPPEVPFALAFELPTQLRVGQAIPVALCLRNTGAGTIRGAALAVVDGLGHGVAHAPGQAQGFELAAGAELRLAQRFELPAPPSIAHSYWARALLLVDGVWQLSSRPLLVARGEP